MALKLKSKINVGSGFSLYISSILDNHLKYIKFEIKYDKSSNKINLR